MSQIFRKKSLDRINSPESLDECMKVTNPSIWIFLSAIILLLVGTVIWGFVGKLETTCETVVISKNSVSTCYIHEAYIEYAKTGKQVRVNKVEYTITDIAEDPVDCDTVLNEKQKSLSHLYSGELVYAATLDGTLTNGSYSGSLILEVVSPVTFLFNSVTA